MSSARSGASIGAQEVKRTHELVLRHVANVRQISGLKNSTVVFCLECAAAEPNRTEPRRAAAPRRVPAFGVGRSNLAFEAQHILHAVEQAGLRRWVALQEGQGGSLGWLTVRGRPRQRPVFALPTRAARAFRAADQREEGGEHKHSNRLQK